ncbi:MAG: glycosyltransferase, partial [Candidatus Dormibacteria bacterium]
MQEVALPELSPAPFHDLMDAAAWEEFSATVEDVRPQLRGSTLWHVNSTARGGGVAEMLQSVLCYLVGAGIDTRWLVIDVGPEFFQLTKRMHNLLHGSSGDGGALGDPEMTAYEQALAPNAQWLEDHLRPGDMVVLHDPQALGLTPSLCRLGTPVIWSCHVGVDRANSQTRAAWTQLLPYAELAARCVFSRAEYAWEGLSQHQVAVIPPCLDAFSPKNQCLAPGQVAAILSRAGLLAAKSTSAARFQRQDGSRAEVTSRASMTEDDQVPEDAPLVSQISRWDPLKDHLGVMTAFTEHVPADLGAHLILAGPDPGAVADDPSGQSTHEELCSAWEHLPKASRRRVHLACLPMDDLEQNAAIVNALQRRSQVVAQKSIAEGFGLTVAEAMW